MKRSPLARFRALPGKLLDAVLRRQVRAAGLVDVRGHHLFAPGLDPRCVVIDAGAHTGQFSRAIVDRFGCLCLALEPVPELHARIAQGPRLRKFLLALGGTDGEVTFHLSDNPEANSVHAEIAAELGHRGTFVARISTLGSFLRAAEIERADLLKLDVEGAEIAVLETTGDETLRSLGQITVELHDFLASFHDRRAIAALKRRLRRNGFTCVVLSRPASNHSDTLFINRRRHRLDLAQRLHLFLLRHVTLELRRALHRARAWFA